MGTGPREIRSFPLTGMPESVVQWTHAENETVRFCSLLNFMGVLS